MRDELIGINEDKDYQVQKDILDKGWKLKSVLKGKPLRYLNGILMRILLCRKVGK